MAYYLQQVRNIEVLHMEAEFLVDENKNIWFAYAKNITMRSLVSQNAGINLKDKEKQETELL